ncbi:MAG: hypothetical protein FJ125_06365 [Deltaproteobacteria bacterium]|nr:hypothetical protein [Deltaproteobacteria bacterium]
MPRSIQIEETTVGYLPGVSVGVGNIFVRDYQDAAGQEVRGPTAMLALRPDDPSLPDDTIRVHPGQELTLVGRRYRVEEVSLFSQGSENGYVLIDALDEQEPG